MPALAERYLSLKEELGNQVKLIAVSKSYPSEKVRELYDLGHLDFGENRVQELISKAESLPESIRWHQIGHLQRNKVKSVIPFVSLIHSADSFRILEEINKHAESHGIISVLLQIHIAQEEHKFGFTPGEISELTDNYFFEKYPFLKVTGLMGMATNTSDTLQIRNEFRTLKTLFERLKKGITSLEELSMGMSSDYKIAIDEGSTMVRVGSRLFAD